MLVHKTILSFMAQINIVKYDILHITTAECLQVSDGVQFTGIL